ncbi:hypothetical protein KSC_100980 [Ktedonobacter sp. SOSP1-52]|uniref:hypothetical protein n=1 Tax=Ktedonobacter sp. SOSP1-52 TaxID=2778366 RepID=UPI0019164A7F|nr:hypothetical protein [Ktedonobacter sp. SOSP1-52]GHO71206.1 hypothetical protein KSC_100980 [Ktedonobacter sp. SOSP1-52]
MRAVSAALDDGEERLTLDCLHDHILPTDILRQKVEATVPEQERSLAIQASDPTPEAEVAPKPARSRRKKTAELAQEVASSQEASNGNVPSTPTSSETVVTPAKPKRTRRVGEPKPKRYPVGEQGTEQGAS